MPDCLAYRQGCVIVFKLKPDQFLQDNPDEALLQAYLCFSGADSIVLSKWSCTGPLFGLGECSAQNQHPSKFR